MPDCQMALPLLKALCDETRLNILKMLDAKGELCACRIQDAFQCTQPTISYHMKVLVDAGLVSARKEGCLTCYRVTPGVVCAIEDLLGEIAALVKEGGKVCS